MATLEVSRTDSASTMNNEKVETIGTAKYPGSNKDALAVEDTQYPHGWRLVLLAGSSIIAVFLMALDQVSDWPYSRMRVSYFSY